MTDHTDLTERERLTLRECLTQVALGVWAPERAIRAVERILAARAPSGDTAAQAQAKADALRSQRDFFLAVDMDAAADHCEQAAISWDSSRDDADHLAQAPDPDTSTAAVPVDEDEVNRVARLLIAAWEAVDGPVGVSRVANFADMARAVIADRRAKAWPDTSTATVPVEVYVREPGPEVTEAESLYDGGPWERDEWGWSGASESDLTWDVFASNYGPVLSSGSIARLRDAGGEGRG